MVISNDSDLMFPIKAVRQRFGLDIGVYDPSRQRTSAELKSVATFYFPIREGPIKASQFPDVLTDGTGTFWKPPGW